MRQYKRARYGVLNDDLNHVLDSYSHRPRHDDGKFHLDEMTNPILHSEFTRYGCYLLQSSCHNLISMSRSGRLPIYEIRNTALGLSHKRVEKSVLKVLPAAKKNLMRAVAEVSMAYASMIYLAGQLESFGGPHSSQRERGESLAYIDIPIVDNVSCRIERFPTALDPLCTFSVSFKDVSRKRFQKRKS